MMIVESSSFFIWKKEKNPFKKESMMCVIHWKKKGDIDKESTECYFFFFFWERESTMNIQRKKKRREFECNAWMDGWMDRKKNINKRPYCWTTTLSIG